MIKGLKKFYDIVDAFQALPTVGKKSALRFAYHLIVDDQINALKLAHVLEEGVRSLRVCKNCKNISENEICEICLDEEREEIICLVQSVKDVFIIEENKIFKGRYHVLNKVDDESINHLKNRIKHENIKELIFAFTPGIASDGLILYIEDKLKDIKIKLSKIAQGVPTGVSLENIDFLSLSKAFTSRTKC